MEASGDRRPIFVVGASRSGTNLVRAILNRSRDLWIVRETHYFDDLRVRLGRAAARQLGPADVARCERYFGALAAGSYHLRASGARELDLAALRARAGALGGGGDAWFQAFCEGQVAARGRGRWGEKTPRHAFRLAEIFAAFPDALVISTLRDPRAVVASYRDWPSQVRRAAAGPAAQSESRRLERSYHPVLAGLAWASAVSAALDARARFGDARVRLVAYEALVSDPEPVVRELAEWLDLPYSPDLLDVGVVRSSYGQEDVRGISTASLERWRTRLPASHRAAVEIVCAGLMEYLGYRREPGTGPSWRLAGTLAGVPLAAGHAALANHARAGRVHAYVVRRGRMASRVLTGRAGHGRQ